jgi:hypothetical protein
VVIQYFQQLLQLAVVEAAHVDLQLYREVLAAAEQIWFQIQQEDPHLHQDRDLLEAMESAITAQQAEVAQEALGQMEQEQVGQEAQEDLTIYLGAQSRMPQEDLVEEEQLVLLH